MNMVWQPFDMSTEVVLRGDIVTMDTTGTVVTGGAVVVSGSTIAWVGPHDEMPSQFRSIDKVIGTSESIVTPGYVNAHQHLTGDRLVQSCIPDAIDSQDAIFNWAVPVHSAHSGDDDELSATLAAVAAVTNGITCTVEAGTVAHPERVVDGLARVGLRATIGQWGWDVGGVPFSAPTDEVLDRQRQLLDRFPTGGMVEAWVTLVGHDLMSDGLSGLASWPAPTTGGSRFTCRPIAETP
jgi:5-methylthioadenosine/S-adenosylhomocysteine deaminase